jgi:hypothetical protein
MTNRLVNFINSLEDKRKDNSEVLIWIPFDKLKEFSDIVAYEYFKEDGIISYLQEDAVCCNIGDMIKFFDIDYYMEGEFGSYQVYSKTGVVIV